MGLEILPGIGAYHHIQSTPSTTWTIIHKLSTTAPIADSWIVDGADNKKVLPVSVVASDASTCVITFSTAQSGEATIT